MMKIETLEQADEILKDVFTFLDKEGHHIIYGILTNDLKINYNLKGSPENLVILFSEILKEQKVFRAILKTAILDFEREMASRN